MKGTQPLHIYVNALKRLKEGLTWQGIANYLTEALDDGRTVYKAEPWKMVNQGKWSPKVAQGLLAAEEVPGPRKRFRLHAEFHSAEEMEEFTRHYRIDGNTYTFTEWTKRQFESSMELYRQIS